MKKSILKKYALLVAATGANVQKGQEVIISASIDQVEFVTYVVEACYKLGASEVRIEWSQPPKIVEYTVKYQTVEKLGEVKNWQIEKIKDQVKNLPVRIYIESDAPDVLKNVDMAKMAQARRLSYPIIKPFRDEMDNKYQWTIVGVPSVEWAKQVFPNLSKKDAVEALWDAILKTSRVTEDPVKSWKEHNEFLLNRCNYLNSLNIDYLEYKSGIGTNFKVWMLDKCQWIGGGEESLKGIYYNPNIPTEECFTSPIKGRAEGKVVASKPLSYNGDLIEDFWFRFENGKVVEYGAKKGEHLLKEMLTMDEGACFLGECALVPFESPVNQTGILFYNTLYDENACCHFALGAGFNDCVIDFEKYEKKDFDEMGINDSMIHVDFMIGTADLTIDAVTRDGKKIAIFKNGTWAF